MEMDQKSSGYPHPAPPPTYDQMQNQGNMYPPIHPQGMPQPMQHYHMPPPHIHYVPPPQPVIVEAPTTIIVTPQVGPDPSSVTCPSCRNTVCTRMEYEATTKTHIFAGLLCLFGCWPCVCIPYCMDSCRNANHYCPVCGAYIGTYKQ